MKAMILAAGQGRRLRPLTDTCPKPMVPIAGRPVLEYVIQLLARHGFDELVINLHHHPEVIQDHFGDGTTWNVRLTYSYEEELRGTAGAVRQMAAFFDERFLVYYGDNLSNVDLTELWEAHASAGEVASLGLLWMDDPTSRGIVELDRHGCVRRFIEKPLADQVFDNYLVNGGIYIFEPEILDWIPATRCSDFSRDVFPRLLEHGRAIYGHRLRGQLLSTDTLERYRDTQQQVDEKCFKLP